MTMKSTTTRVSGGKEVCLADGVLQAVSRTSTIAISRANGRAVCIVRSFSVCGVKVAVDHAVEYHHSIRRNARMGKSGSWRGEGIQRECCVTAPDAGAVVG